MKTVYKVFLLVFVIFIAINLYAFDWQINFFDDENAKFVLSMSAGLLGIFLVFVLNTWSKLSLTNK